MIIFHIDVLEILKNLIMDNYLNMSTLHQHFNRESTNVVIEFTNDLWSQEYNRKTMPIIR